MEYDRLELGTRQGLANLLPARADPGEEVGQRDDCAVAGRDGFPAALPVAGIAERSTPVTSFADPLRAEVATLATGGSLALDRDLAGACL